MKSWYITVLENSHKQIFLKQCLSANDATALKKEQEEKYAKIVEEKKAELEAQGLPLTGLPTYKVLREWY